MAQIRKNAGRRRALSFAVDHSVLFCMHRINPKNSGHWLWIGDSTIY